MINREQLSSLLEHHNEKHPVVSLYVNVELPKKFGSELNSLVRKKIKELHESSWLPVEETARIEKLLADIEKKVKAGKNYFPGTKMVALFADTEGFWREFELPVQYPNRLIVGTDPYVKPLSAAQDQFSRFCLLVSNSHKARILTLQAHQLVEEQEIFVEEELRGSTDTSLKGFGEQRFERSERDLLYKHIKHITDTLFEIYKKGTYDHLLIAAPKDRELPIIMDHLHSYLRKRLIGSFSGRPDEPLESILKKAGKVTDEWDRKTERDLLDFIDTEDYEGGRALKGVGPALKALMNGQVHTLMVKDDYTRGGYICSTDHFLDLSHKKCPLCGRELLEVEDIVNEMVEETINQNGEVRYLKHYGDELKSEGVAARLRFVM